MSASVAVSESARASIAVRRGWLGTLATIAPWLFCLALTILAYSSSLHAGIMFDAALDLPRATNRSWLDILTSAGSSPYYRPVTLLLWKACFDLLGRNEPVLLHLLSLASHVACGWLVYQLGRRLLDRWAGFVAAGLFLWFPLSYQVVAFVDSIFHSLATGFVLAAAVLYWDARKRSSRWLLAGSLTAAGLALFTHESAVVLLALILGLELLLSKQQPAGRVAAGPCSSASLQTSGSRRWAKPLLGGGVAAASSAHSDGFASRPGRRLALGWVALYAVEVLAFLLIWLSVPRYPSSFHFDLPSLRLNALYFLQGLAWPAAIAFGRFGLLLVVLATLAALLALAAARRRLAVAGFGLLWFGAAALPSILLLPWSNYVIDAPRLLYFGSAGIALLWAAALSPSSRRSAVGVLAVGAILAQSSLFVAKRERLLDQGASIVTQLVETATRSGPEAGRTYVNVPAFLGPQHEELPLGHYGVTMLPDYFGLDLTVAALRGVHLPIVSLAYDDLARPWDAAYGFQGKHGSAAELQAAIRQGGGVYFTRFDPGQPRLEYAGRVDASSTGQTLARFGDWAVLEQASANIANGQLALHLVWRALKPAPADYTVFVHVTGSGPQPLAQSDGYPIAGLMPPQHWQPGEVIHDERLIPLPSDAAGKPLHVLVGLYNRANATQRAPATTASGTLLPDASVTIAAEEP